MLDIAMLDNMIKDFLNLIIDTVVFWFIIWFVYKLIWERIMNKILESAQRSHSLNKCIASTIFVIILDTIALGAIEAHTVYYDMFLAEDFEKLNWVFYVALVVVNIFLILRSSSNIESPTSSGGIYSVSVSAGHIRSLKILLKEKKAGKTQHW